MLFSSLLLFLWRIREEVKTSEKSLLEGKEVATQHWLDYEHKVNKQVTKEITIFQLGLMWPIRPQAVHANMQRKV